MKNIFRNINILSAFIIISLLTFNLTAQENIQHEIDPLLKNLPFENFKIELPSFQNKIFNIKDFGALGDGHSLNTNAIQKAIDECSKNGGGVVVIPPGCWITGPIEMKNNVNLHTERGSLILFSPDHKLYPIIKPPGRGFSVMSPVYGANLKNIAVTGEGIFDGSGDTWRPVKKYKTTGQQWKSLLKSGGAVNKDGSMWWPSEEALKGEEYLKNLKKKKNLTAGDFIPARDFMRPYMVLFINCRYVLFDGITVENSPKFAFYPTSCEDVVFKNVNVNNEWWAQNGDGIDINTCRNVLVYKCTVNAGDDGICLKSNDYKKESDEPELQNIVIVDNTVYHGHGGFVIGSDTDGGMRNIFVHNCTFIGTDIGLRFKSARDRGGLVDNIYIKNIFMRDIVNEAVLFNTYYENKKEENKTYAVTKYTPRFKKFYIDSIYCVGAKTAVSIAGLPEMPIQDIHISNIYIYSGRGFESKYAKNISLDNIYIESQTGPVFSLDESADFHLNKIKYPENVRDFMSVSGADSKSILIENTDISDSSQQIRLSGGLNKGVVEIK